MTASWHGTAETLVLDLQRLFGPRLRAVVAYGAAVDGIADAPLSCLVLLDGLTQQDLEACARVASEWARRGMATPLILGQEEFERSLDAFPLEYNEIIRTHTRVFGPDPFDGLTIAHEDLRRACETQAKSHLLHLREGFIEAGNRPQLIAELVTTSAPAFAALLRHMARLSGSRTSTRVEATLDGARAAGLPESLVHDVLSLERSHQLATADAARLFPAYLAAVEQIARTVDTWRG